MTKEWREVLIFSILLIFCLSNPGKDYYLFKWGLLALSINAIVFYKIRKKYSTTLGLFLLYIMTSPLLVSLFRAGKYTHARNSILYEPLKAWVYLICLALVLIWIEPEKFLKPIRWLVPANILFCFACFMDHGVEGIVGFEYNISVNATLMALMLPFCMTWWAVLGTLIVVLYCKVSVGLLATLAATWAYGMAKCKRKIVYLILTASSGLMVSYLALVYYGPELLNLNGRFSTWQLAIDLVQRENMEIFGLGIGTFSHILPVIKAKFPGVTPENMVMLWAHNDYIQLFFEGGLVSLLLGAFLVAQITCKSWGDPRLFSFFIAYLVSCFGNFPSHLATSSLLLVVAISLTYKEVYNEKI